MKRAFFRLRLVTRSIAFLTTIFLLLPFIALIANLPKVNAASSFGFSLGDAVTQSLVSSWWALVIIIAIGTPVGFYMARSRHLVWRFVEFSVYIPLLMPPLVIGLLLMYLIGPYGWIGWWLSKVQVTLVNSVFAVVIAQIYEALPYYVLAASAAFKAVDRSFERASLSLGRTPTRTFVSITLPLAFRGLSTGIAMAFARAIGAFGAVIVIAYYPHTLPVQIWLALQEQGLPVALPLSLLLVAIAMPLPLLLIVWRIAKHD